MDVALYINDARALELVLLGGQTGAEVEGHDWEHMLTVLGLLHRDHQIASVVHVTGAAMMVGALVWGAPAAVPIRGRGGPRRGISKGQDTESRSR
jgi:hypothetical protein